MKIYMMVGIPGSGKSYEAVKIREANENTEIVSYLDIANILYPGNKTFSVDENEVITKEMIDITASLLRKGYDVVFDSTNIELKDRLSTIKKIKADFPDVNIFAIVVNTPRKICIQNCDGNAELVDSFIRLFNCPQPYEGFENIIFTDNSRFHYSSEKSLIYATHLSGCVDENKINCWDRGTKLSMIFGEDDIANCEASRWQDIGLMYNESYPYSCEDVNHANISAYFIITHPYVIRKIDDMFMTCFLQIVFLINYHSIFSRFENQLTEDFIEVKDKVKAIFGNEKYESLMQFIMLNRCLNLSLTKGKAV